LLKLLNTLSASSDYTLLTSEKFGQHVTTEDSKRISLVQAYVKNNFQKKITVTEVAGLIGLTDVSFCSFFKKVHNKTFFTFLNEFRISLACKLLIESDATVTEIGYECGFNSISFFHRQFTKFIRLPPLEYRKSYRSITDHSSPRQDLTEFPN
jgi:transcriptional regulator GlxA family with amidase domain